MTEEKFAGRPVSKKENVSLKETNPKDAVGVRKVAMSAVPAQPLLELGLAMMEGARKYGRHNYRIAGVRASVYYDAALRHLMAWWEGEDIDAESGLSHLTKAMACLAVVRDGMCVGNWVDDRPPSLDTGWQAELNKKAGDLIDRLPISVPAYVKETTFQPSSVLTDYSKPSTKETWLQAWVRRFDQKLLEELDAAPTTHQLPLPLNDSPPLPPSIPGYIDPKQSEWSPLLEREVPTGSGGKFRGEKRN